MLTYLRFSGLRVALLVSFNERAIRTGLRRFVGPAGEKESYSKEEKGHEE
jgi:hypothetical protein